MGGASRESNGIFQLLQAACLPRLVASSFVFKDSS